MQKHLFRGTLAGLLVVLSAPAAWSQDGMGAPILTRPSGSRPAQPVEPVESQPAPSSGSQPAQGSAPAQSAGSSQSASGQPQATSGQSKPPAGRPGEDVLEATAPQQPPQESLNDPMPTMMVPLPPSSTPTYSSGQDAFDEGGLRKFEEDDKEASRSGRRGRRGQRRGSILADDTTALESYRLLINRYVRENKFAEVEPYYKSYIQLLEKTRADKAQIAGALQRYSELLKKLGRIPEAKAAEIKAHGLLTGEEIRTTYSLKEFQLGMSLDDFVRLPPPVSAEGPVKVICSCDAGQKVEILTPEDEAAGLVLCGYWVASGNPPLYTPHKMTIANIECVPDFRFIREKGVYRLMEITTSFYSSYFPNMKTALQGKFGPPATNAVNKRRTETGNIFPETMIEWDNGISKIRLRNIDGLTFDKARLRFVHKPLHQIWSKAIQTNEEQPKTNSIGDL